MPHCQQPVTRRDTYKDIGLGVKGDYGNSHSTTTKNGPNSFIYFF